MLDGKSTENVNKKTNEIIDKMVILLIRLGLVQGEIHSVYKGSIDCRKGKDPLGDQKLVEVQVTNFDEESGVTFSEKPEEINVSMRSRNKLYEIARMRAYKESRRGNTN